VVRRWWEPPPPRGQKTEIAVFGEMVTDAVTSRLISDVPLGVFLSGGMDSTAIMLCAKRVKEDLIAVGISFDEPLFDEGERQRQVAEEIGCNLRQVRVNAHDLRRNWQSVLACMDSPSINGINVWFVCLAAKNAGLTVAISGLGGDEVFMGYKIFRRLKHRLPLTRLLRLVGDISGLFSPNTKTTFSRFGRPVEGLYLLRRACVPLQTVRALLGEDTVRCVHNPASLLPRSRGLPPLPRWQRLEMFSYMHDQLLRDADQFSMAHSLEVRVPLLDHLLVELVLQQQPRYVLGEQPKWLLARASGMPKRWTEYPKRGFLFPFEVWFRKHLTDEVCDLLFCNPLQLFNTAAVERLWRHYREGRVQWRQIWALCVVNYWLTQHM